MKQIAVLLLIFLTQTGDDPVVPTLGEEQSARFLDFYKKEAAKYQMYIGKEDQLKFNPDPVFRFASPIDNNFNGTLFVWTRDGRAEVIGSIWAIPEKTPDGKRRIVHEFQTLATAPVEGKISGTRAWFPKENGIDPQPVPDAPKPAATAALRLIQIRAMARDFSAREDFNGRSDELRMLPQPIYRYESESKDRTESKDVPDGAVFAFLNEFDPEVFLIIDERSTPDGMRWHYAFARFCRMPISARHKDVEVWTCELNKAMTDPKSPHYCNFAATKTDWELPASDGSDEQKRLTK